MAPADYAASKRRARENDASDRARYQDQMREEGLDPATGRPEGAPTSRTPLYSRTHGAIKGGSGGTVAGVMLGTFAFLIVRSYIEGRWPGVKAFLAAKFVNKTTAAPSPVPAKATPTAPPTTTTTPTNPRGPQPATTTTTPGKAILA